MQMDVGRLMVCSGWIFVLSQEVPEILLCLILSALLEVQGKQRLVGHWGMRVLWLQVGNTGNASQRALQECFHC